MYNCIKQKNTLNDLKYFIIPDNIKNLCCQGYFILKSQYNWNDFNILTFFSIIIYNIIYNI